MLHAQVITANRFDILGESTPRGISTLQPLPSAPAALPKPAAPSTSPATAAAAAAVGTTAATHTAAPLQPQPAPEQVVDSWEQLPAGEEAPFTVIGPGQRPKQQQERSGLSTTTRSGTKPVLSFFVMNGVPTNIEPLAVTEALNAPLTANHRLRIKFCTRCHRFKDGKADHNQPTESLRAFVSTEEARDQFGSVW